MLFDDYRAYDWFRTAIALGCGAYAGVFVIGIWAFSDLNIKIGLAGLGFAALGIAFSLQSAVETEVMIRKLNK